MSIPKSDYDKILSSFDDETINECKNNPLIELNYINKNEEYKLFLPKNGDFIEDINDYKILMPIKNAINNAESKFWIVDSINYDNDVLSFYRAFSEEINFSTKLILTFLASIDSLISTNLIENFIDEMPNFYTQRFLKYQAYIESTHSIVYTKVFSLFIDNEDDKNYYIDIVKNLSIVKNKVDFINKYTKPEEPFWKRLIIFAFIEGLTFQGNFAFIYWLGCKMQIPALHDSNELIRKDEEDHFKFTCLLIKQYIYPKIKSDIIYDILNQIIKYEYDYFEYILKDITDSIMTIKNMKNYLKYQADEVLTLMGVDKLYNVKNPFPFVNIIKLHINNDKFNTQNTNYTVGIKKILN